MLEVLLNTIWESVPGPILWAIALTVHTVIVWYGMKLGARTPQD